MSKTRFLSILVIFLLILNMGIIAFFLFIAPKPGPPGAMRNKGVKYQIIQKLQLNDEQVRTFDNLVEVHIAKLEGNRKELEQTRAAIFKEFSKEDPAKKDSLLTRIANIQREIESLHITHFRNIKNLCRPDQLPAFEELVNDLSENLRKRPPRGP